MKFFINFFLPQKIKENTYEHYKSIGLIYILIISTLIIIVNLIFRILIHVKENIFQLYGKPLSFIIIFIITLFLLRNNKPRLAKNIFGISLLLIQMLSMIFTRHNGYAVEKFVGGFYVLLMIYVVAALYIDKGLFILTSILMLIYTYVYYKISLPLFDEKDLYLATKGLIYIETTIIVLALILYWIFFIFHKAEQQETEINKKLLQRNRQLSELLKKIHFATKTITKFTKEIHNLSTALNQNASNEAAATEQTAQAAEEFQEIFNQIATNSKQTLALAQRAAVVFEENKKAFEDTLKSVQEIKEKITFIRKISNKSDILAINASIEANKYGDEAKGFRVIANEIRKLAEQTNLYGQEISNLVEQNYKLSNKSIQILESFIKEFQRLKQAVEEINANVTAQQTIIQQINSSIIEVNNSAQSTATAAEELDSAIDQLKEVTDKLNI